MFHRNGLLKIQFIVLTDKKPAKPPCRGCGLCRSLADWKARGSCQPGLLLQQRRHEHPKPLSAFFAQGHFFTQGPNHLITSSSHTGRTTRSPLSLSPPLPPLSVAAVAVAVATIAVVTVVARAVATVAAAVATVAVAADAIAAFTVAVATVAAFVAL